MIEQARPAAKQQVPPPAAGGWATGQFFLALLGLVVLIGLLWLGFVYLSGSKSANLLNAVIAIVWGVGGVAALFTITNTLIEALPARARDSLRPFLFFLPGVGILFLFLTIPTLITLYQSFFNGDSTQFVGLSNYAAVFTDSAMLESFRNNLIW